MCCTFQTCSRSSVSKWGWKWFRNRHCGLVKNEINSHHDWVMMTVMTVSACWLGFLNSLSQICMTSDQVSIWHRWAQPVHEHMPIRAWRMPTALLQGWDQSGRRMQLAYLLPSDLSQVPVETSFPSIISSSSCCHVTPKHQIRLPGVGEGVQSSQNSQLPLLQLCSSLI